MPKCLDLFFLKNNLHQFLHRTWFLDSKETDIARKWSNPGENFSKQENHRKKEETKPEFGRVTMY